MQEVLKMKLYDMLEHFKNDITYDTEKTWKEKAKQYNLKKDFTWRQTCIDILCDECQYNRGKMNKFHNIMLCRKCSINEKYSLINKSRGKDIYFLNEKDFEKLDYIENGHVHFNHKASIKLYSEADIIKRFKNKHGLKEEDDYENVLEQLHKNRLKRMKQKRRKDELKY